MSYPTACSNHSNSARQSCCPRVERLRREQKRAIPPRFKITAGWTFSFPGRLAFANHFFGPVSDHDEDPEYVRRDLR